MSKSKDINNSEQILINIGKNIRKFREEKGMSQELLSYNADIDRSYIGRIENAKVSITITKLCHVANALSRPIEDFLKE